MKLSSSKNRFCSQGKQREASHYLGWSQDLRRRQKERRICIEQE
jgi:hypothetical protein